MDKQVKEIIRYFDFKKVHKIFSFLEWRWFQEDSNDFEIPSVEQIKLAAYTLLTKVANNPDIKVLTSGGLQVRRLKNSLKLEFVVENWEAYE